MASVCKTCNGQSVVNDGEITRTGGVAYENGPIQCVKDCPDCAPVPPAGDVEVAGYRYRSLPDEWELMSESPFPDGRAFWQFGRETLEPVYSHAHVTRLTAERDGLREENLVLNRWLATARKERDLAQSELTKALEALALQSKVIEFATIIDKQAFAKGTQNVGVTAFRAMGDALSDLAHQSAPAAKGDK